MILGFHSSELKMAIFCAVTPCRLLYKLTNVSEVHTASNITLLMEVVPGLVKIKQPIKGDAIDAECNSVMIMK
jgi:hypothetical protein